jgi:hypothetical protein
MFTWRKLGKVFDPTDWPETSWMKEFAQAPCVLLCGDYLRVFFSCRPRPDGNGQYVSRAAYVDLNRKNLFEVLRVAGKPALNLGGPGMFDEFGTYPTSVVRNGSQVWAYYGGWTRCESVPFNVAIGVAVSQDDGVSFKKIGNGPVLSYSIDEPFILSGPKIRKFDNTWYLWYIAGERWIEDNGRPEPVYRIRMASSIDGITWKKHNRDLIERKLGCNESQASPDVIFCNGRYHMFFCYRHGTNYRNMERGYRIGYAASDDMINWTRDDDIAGLDVSAEGWDSEMVSYPHVFELDNENYMMYLGNQVGRYGFGLARLEGCL